MYTWSQPHISNYIKSTASYKLWQVLIVIFEISHRQLACFRLKITHVLVWFPLLCDFSWGYPVTVNWPFVQMLFEEQGEQNTRGAFPKEGSKWHCGLKPWMCTYITWKEASRRFIHSAAYDRKTMLVYAFMAKIYTLISSPLRTRIYISCLTTPIAQLRWSKIKFSPYTSFLVLYPWST